MPQCSKPTSNAPRAAHVARWLGAVALLVGCSEEPPSALTDDGSGTGGSPGPGMSAAGAMASAPSMAPGSSGNATAGSSSPSQPSDGGMDMNTAMDAASAADATPVEDAAPGATRSTGPGDWGPGDYPPNLMSPTWLEMAGVAGQGANVRQYKVHVPPSYEPGVPAPLVFCIHGLGQDALLFCVTGAAMVTKSDEAGFVLVMPNGFQNSWNAGTCCGGASAQQLDDVALFRAIFAEVGKHVNVDLDRVYATGLSNGGYMSYRLACEAADLFTAVAPAAGAIGTNDIGGGTNPASNFTICEPSQPVSVLDIHGTADPLIPYALQAPTISRLAMSYGCATTTMPASQPPSAGDTRCVSNEGCPSGIELTACTIQNGGHCWFGSADCGTGGGAIGLAIVGANSDTMKNTDAIWDFFERTWR